jgi:hypothetical protein
MLPPLSIKHGSHLMFMLEQSQFWHEAVAIIPCNMQNRLAHSTTYSVSKYFKQVC